MKFLTYNKIVSGFSIATIALALSFGISYVSAAWSAPQSTPPNCTSGQPGCDAPVNVGTTHQAKLGSLSVNTTTSSPDAYGLDVFGISRFFGNLEIGTIAAPATVKIVNGSQGAGKVLTSDAAGVAIWQTSAGGPVKAWVKWSRPHTPSKQNGTIASSYNVSSVVAVTTTSFGRPKVTFQTPMSSADYAVVCNGALSGTSPSAIWPSEVTASYFVLEGDYGANEDALDTMSCVVLGN